MSELKDMYRQMGIDEKVLEISDKIISDLSQRFQ